MTKLREETLSIWEVAAQSVANIAPSATPALIVPLVFASAGNGLWLSYALATAAMLLVSAQVNVFAARSASPGALYSFTADGLGLRCGAVSGWALFLAYIFTVAATLAGFTNYASVIIESLFHVQVGIAPGLMIMLLGLLTCGWIARHDIRLSTRAMLLLEIVAVGLIIFLAVMFFVHVGHVTDPLQLSVTGVTSRGIRMGLVLALFSFVGFESATALGEEAKDPLRSIPRSVLLSVLIVGIFFTLISYTLVFAFRGLGTPLDKASSPLVDLANASGFPSLGLPLAFGALIGQFACSLASLTAAARVMYMMARHGFFHPKAGDVHEIHGTPHVAVTACTFISGLAPMALLIFGIGSLDIFGYLGTIATFGFLVSYLLVSIAAPVYLIRRGELCLFSLVATVATVLTLIIPIVGSVYPVPETPYNYLPYVFLGLMVPVGFRFKGWAQ